MERMPKTTPRRIPTDNRRRNRQSNKKLTDIIINNATLFFGQTEATKKESKGCWSNKDIKKSGNEHKIPKKASKHSKSRNIANSQNKIPTINKRIKNKR